MTRTPAPSSVRLRRQRRVIVLALVAIGGAAAALLAVGPLAPTRVTRLEPQAVRALGEGGDPLVVMVGVPWSRDGYCSGQFTVAAIETPTRIRIGPVTNREHRFGGCAGLGTRDGMAWAELRLDSPPGTRTFVRDSDGATLAVLAP